MSFDNDPLPLVYSPPYFKPLRCSTVNWSISAFSSLVDPLETKKFCQELRNENNFKQLILPANDIIPTIDVSSEFLSDG